MVKEGRDLRLKAQFPFYMEVGAVKPESEPKMLEKYLIPPCLPYSVDSQGKKGNVLSSDMALCCIS